MLNNFNKLIFESLISKDSYSFNTDNDGNIFCTFSIKDDYVINAKEFNKVLSFYITSKDGNSENLSEKEFSYRFNDEYKEFKEALQQYKNDDFSLNEVKKEDKLTRIKDFENQLNNEEIKDQNVKLSKDIEINDKLFNFKILNDLMVENYCQCIFEIFDKKQDETFRIKSLLFVKKYNSIIIKLILQNLNGENIQIMTSEDFKSNYYDDYCDFKTAIIKFEEYFRNL